MSYVAEAACPGRLSSQGVLFVSKHHELVV